MKDVILELDFSLENNTQKKNMLDIILRRHRLIVKSKDGAFRWLISSGSTQTLVYKQQKVEEVEGIDGKVKIWVDMDHSFYTCPDIVISWIYHTIGKRLNWKVWDGLSVEQQEVFFNDQMQLT